MTNKTKHSTSPSMSTNSSQEAAPYDALDNELGKQASMLTTILWWLGLVLLVYVQFLYWYGGGGVVQHAKLKSHIASQEAKLAELTERNRQLKAKVNDLKHGNAVIEEHARLDLGLIKSGETFIQINTVQARQPKD